MTKIEEMMNFCEVENIFWFCDLVDYAINNRKDWFRTLVTDHGANTMGLYLADKAYEAGLLTEKQYDDFVEDYY